MMHIRCVALLGIALVALLSPGCGDSDARTETFDPDTIWDDGEQVDVRSPVAFVPRVEQTLYGLPRPGMKGLKDLIEVMDEQPGGFDVPDIYAAPSVDPATDQCRGGDFATLDALPMTIEAVVTLHPRQYMKPQICGQDERHYGNFTIADDTGGIIVLRDSRIAPYTFGDRLRLEIKGVGRTFSVDTDTRAVLIADIEKLPENSPIHFTDQQGPFQEGDIGNVRRVTGWVEQPPTNNNFNTMVLASAPIEKIELDEPGRLTGPDRPNGLLQCVRTCEAPAQCPSVCPRTSDTDLCADLCLSKCFKAITAEPERPVNEITDIVLEEIPACWVVSLDAELGRRGYGAALGEQLRAVGPVVNDFDRKIWIASPGQLEFLD